MSSSLANNKDQVGSLLSTSLTQLHKYQGSPPNKFALWRLPLLNLCIVSKVPMATLNKNIY